MEKNMEKKQIQTLATSSMCLPETAAKWMCYPKANGLFSQHPALYLVDQVSNLTKKVTKKNTVDDGDHLRPWETV